MVGNVAGLLPCSSRRAVPCTSHCAMPSLPPSRCLPEGRSRRAGACASAQPPCRPAPQPAPCARRQGRRPAAAPAGMGIPGTAPCPRCNSMARGRGRGQGWTRQDHTTSRTAGIKSGVPCSTARRESAHQQLTAARSRSRCGPPPPAPAHSLAGACAAAAGEFLRSTRGLHMSSKRCAGISVQAHVHFMLAFQAAAPTKVTTIQVFVAPAERGPVPPRAAR